MLDARWSAMRSVSRANVPCKKRRGARTLRDSLGHVTGPWHQIRLLILIYCLEKGGGNDEQTRIFRGEERERAYSKGTLDEIMTF